MMRSAQPRFRFDGHSLFIEKNGKRFDLKGQRIK
jgi:endoglucanase